MAHATLYNGFGDIMNKPPLPASLSQQVLPLQVPHESPFESSRPSPKHLMTQMPNGSPAHDSDISKYQQCNGTSQFMPICKNIARPVSCSPLNVTIQRPTCRKSVTFQDKISNERSINNCTPQTVTICSKKMADTRQQCVYSPQSVTIKRSSICNNNASSVKAVTNPSGVYCNAAQNDSRRNSPFCSACPLAKGLNNQSPRNSPIQACVSSPQPVTEKRSSICNNAANSSLVKTVCNASGVSCNSAASDSSRHSPFCSSCPLVKGFNCPSPRNTPVKALVELRPQSPFAIAISESLKSKSYKSFSTKSALEISPLENPLILSPVHMQDFQTVKQQEWKEFSANTSTKKESTTTETQQSSVTKKYVEEELIVGNGKSLIDLNEIEKSAKDVVEETIEKSVCTAEQKVSQVSEPQGLISYVATVVVEEHANLDQASEEASEKVKEKIAKIENVIESEAQSKILNEKRSSSTKCFKEIKREDNIKQNVTIQSNEISSKKEISLDEAKVNAMKAAHLLSQQATEKNVKVPCVVANLPTRNQTDMLLKTFFIHLTDVMVALTHMITNDGNCICSRTSSPLCTKQSTNHEVNVEKKCNKVVEMMQEFSKNEIFSGTAASATTNEEKSTVTSVVNNNTECREAFKEVMQNTMGVDVTVDGKDPLEWLADLDAGKNTEIKTSEIKEIVSVKDSTMSEDIKVTESGSVQEDSQIVKAELQEANASLSMQKEQIVECESQQITEIHEEKTEIYQTMIEKNEFVAIKESSEIISTTDSRGEEYIKMESIGGETIMQVCEVKSAEKEIGEEDKYVGEKIVKEERRLSNGEIVTETVPLAKKPQKGPQTPNTDEYLFRLDVKLEGRRSKTPDSYQIEPTVHEDLSIVRRPELKKTQDMEGNEIPGDEEKEGKAIDPSKDINVIQDLSKNILSTILDPTGNSNKLVSKIALNDQNDLTLKTDTGKQDVSTFSTGKEVSSSKGNEISNSNVEALSCVASSELSSSNITDTITQVKGTETAISSSEVAKACNTSESKKKTVSESAETSQVAQTDVSSSSDVKSSSNIAQSSNAFASVTNASCSSETTQEASLASETVVSAVETSANAEKVIKAVAVASSIETAVVTSEVTETALSSTQVITNASETNLSNTASIATSQNTQVSSVVCETSATNSIASVNLTTGSTLPSKASLSLQDCPTDSRPDIVSADLAVSNTLEEEYQEFVKMNGATVHPTETSVTSCDVGSITSTQVTSTLEEETKAEGSVSSVSMEEPPVTMTMASTPKCFASVEPTRISMQGGNPDPNAIEDIGKPGLTCSEVSQIMSGEEKVEHVQGLQRVLASHMNRSPDPMEDPNGGRLLPQASFLKRSAVFRALNEEAIKTHEDKIREQRQWTTFLQRPDRPVPYCKRMEPLAPTEIVEPYKVNIKKQPKKPEFSILTEGVFLIPQVPILVPEPTPEYLTAPSYLEDSSFPDLEDTGIALPPPQQKGEPKCDEEIPAENKEESEGKEETVEEDKAEEPAPAEKSWTEALLEDSLVEDLPVEEQLMKVQKQLEALSKLPAAIQQTLDMVSKQLGKMVSKPEEPHKVEEAQQNGETVPQEEKEEKEENKEPETEGAVEEAKTECNGNADVEDEKKEAAPQENGVTEITEIEEQVETKTEVKKEVKIEEAKQEQVTKLNEEMMIKKIKQEVISELAEQHAMRLVKERPTPQPGAGKARPRPVFGPLSPAPRAVVLPGGRRWKGPKDAFTDSFIAETLSSQATIIQGHTLGVNFMKYNKPPVTLEHLKDSSVYKMIHDMEEPVQGVMARAMPDMPESDFREKCRSVTPSNFC